jgi:retron-type reverse transcriptase
LYNFSFSTGTVPDKFKIAQVIPVFKNGSQTCVNNYRPISLLSVFNRILEKLMYGRLIKYVENKKILFENQFGFRSGHSTTQAVTLIIDKIQKAIENKCYSCGIFLNLSKAFDTVNHLI